MKNNTAVNVVQKANITNLPKELQVALNAIELPEVQEIIKKLASFHLGVFMPHKHNDLTGEFEVLPFGEIQVESNLEVKFMNLQEAYKIRTVETGWRWNGNEIKSASECVSRCESTYIQSQGDSHNRYHSKK